MTSPSPRRTPGGLPAAFLRRVLVVSALTVALTPIAGCNTNTTGGSDDDSSTPTIAASDVSRIAAAASNKAAQATASSPAAGTSPHSAIDLDHLTVPDAAKAHTKDGAIAFVKFYWETIGKLDAHPRQGVIEALSLPSCESCRMQATVVRDMATKGDHVDTRNTRLTDFKVREDSVADSVVVTFTQTTSGSQRISARGKREEIAPLDLKVASRADWGADGWKLGASGADAR